MSVVQVGLGVEAVRETGNSKLALQDLSLSLRDAGGECEPVEPVGPVRTILSAVSASDPANLVNFEELWAWIARFHSLQGARLLDVGAGGGTLVRYLRHRGVFAEGLELSAPLYSHFLAGDPAFTQGDLAGFLSARSERFDIVTAFDVLEHVDNPSAFLEDAAAALTHGGVLCLSTPDVGSITARLAGRRWHFYNRYHLSLFSRATLERAAASAGLVLIDCSHRGRRRSVGYMLRYGVEFIFGGRAPRWRPRWMLCTLTSIFSIRSSPASADPGRTVRPDAKRTDAKRTSERRIRA